ncbi:MAG TPA: DUF6600 domain-containing protein, partial [Thermoanaerobaculia bacterium]|nr:DUF6600 domain-containing protein [Thermoanaerobaculia bacterium]
ETPMRKAALLTFLALALTLPTFADERHQSYISYDDGGTMVRTAEDGKEIEAHRNLPIYPGDQVTTARRGRTEVRLSDGNVIGIDRTTAVTFRSILDNYDGDDNETIAELKYGKVAVYRTDVGHDHVRLDTDNASYVAYQESIYSVETDAHGRDRVTVFEGQVEVRTPNRSSRLRSGESATVDEKGPYDLVGDQRDSADDFERWFLRRSERFDQRSTRYVDRRLSYWNDDLDEYGRWVNVVGIGWSWRPYVAVGWRPYYHGYWSHRHGCLTWVSYDPWGWGTYHYGRWAFDPGYGWVWVPGYGYSPAWVYWLYGSNYVGWAPAGYWDCHRGYYDWAYRPYRNRDFGFGFYGRVRVSDMDLRPWTFIDSRTIVSNRVDRAALTTDVIKQRLGRNNGGYATVGSGPARFTNEELPDPADAIRRRGLDGRGTGRETGAPPTDLTPFFRRDNEVSGTIRDRIVRGRGGSGSTVTVGGSITRGGGTSGSSSGATGGLAPIDGSSSVAPIDRRGGLAPIDRGDRGGSTTATTPTTPTTGTDRGDRGGIDRRGGNNNDDSSRGDTTRSSGSWRDRIGDRGSVTPRETTPTPSTGDTTTERPRDTWRGRVRADDPPSTSTTPRESTGSSGSSDVPRRVIDRIGGARVYPRDSDDSSSTRERDTTSSSTRERDTSSSTRERSSNDRPSRTQSDSGSRDSGSRSSGSNNNNSGSSNNGNRDNGGHIKRDH